MRGPFATTPQGWTPMDAVVRRTAATLEEDRNTGGSVGLPVFKTSRNKY